MLHEVTSLVIHVCARVCMCVKIIKDVCVLCVCVKIVIKEEVINLRENGRSQNG